MKRILVVDNDPVMLKFMTNLLENKGHQVLSADDGLPALEILNSFVPDVMFVDLVMSYINGDKLCRIVRKTPRLRGIYIVVLSAIAPEESVKLAELGADACIAKGPFNKMSEHVLDLISQIDLNNSGSLSRKTKGLEDHNHNKIVQELLSSTKHFQVMLGSITEGVMELTLEGKIVYANPAAISMVSIPEESLLGLNLHELFLTNQRKRVEELFAKIDQAAQAVTETSLALLNNKDVMLKILPIEDKECRSFMIILNDMTDRKSTEKSLKLTQFAIDHSSDAALWMEPDGRIIYVNEAACRHLDYSRKELLTMTVADIDPDFSRENWPDQWAEVKRQGTILLESQHRTKDGRQFPVETVNNYLKFDGREYDCTFARDISDRKREEEKVRRLQKELQIIMDSVPALIAYKNTNNRYIRINKTYADSINVPRSSIEGKSAFDITPNRELAEAYWRDDREVISSGIPKRNIIEPLVTDETRWLQTDKIPYRDENGKIAGIIAFCIDITSRLRAEKALKESHQTLLTILDTISADIYVADLDTHEVIFANKHMRDSFGHDLVGHKCWQVFRGGTRPCDFCTNAKLVDRKGQPRGVVVWEAENPITGRWYINHDQAIRWLNGRLVRIQIATDATERKQAENALKESEEKYRTLVESSSDAILLMDPERRVVSCNQAFLDLFGYERDELEGKSIRLIHQSDDSFRSFGERAYPVIHRVGTYRTEWDFMRKDGSVFPAETVTSAIRLSETLIDGYVAIIRDFTERTRMENAIKDDREKLLSLFDSIDEPIYVSDPKSYEVLYVNTSTKDVFGQNIVGKKCHKVFQNLNEPCDFCTNPILFAEDQENAYTWEFQNKRNGRWYRCIDKAISWPDGRKVRYELAIDIHARKQAEDALRENEEKYRQLFQLSSSALFLIERKTRRILDLNQAGIDVYGYTREEALKMKADDFSTEPEKTFQAIARGEAVIPVRYHRKKDGTLFPAEISICYFPLRGKDVCLTAIHDITAREQAERELRNSEERYRATVQSIPDSISISRLKDGLILYVNEGFSQIFGYSREEVIGKTAYNLDLYVNPKVRKRLARVLKKEGEVQGIELKFRKKDGTVVEALFSARTLQYNEEECMVVVVKDITSMKQTERERARLQHQLQHIQKLEAIGVLAGGVAHDFNNILSAIVGFTDLSLDDVAKGTILHSNLQEVRKASRRARDLIKQILAFSRQSTEERKPLEIAPIAKEVIKLLRASLPSTIEIRSNIRTDLGVILADPTEIHQVLMNLCTNAGQAMQEEGGTLELNLARMTATSAFAASHPDLNAGSYLRLTVRDTGCGMRADIVQRIFDPYFTTKEKGHGTGLGLAVVHGIVKDLGGEIRVESEPGKGTSFEVYLPVFDREIETETKSVESFRTGNGQSVLFVDDEYAVTRVFEEILKSLGYKPETRTSSIEALELFRAKPDEFDLVITDMTMPNMTGDKLAKELLRIRPDIPIILCTGFSEKISPQKAEDIGVRAFLMKPIEKREMAQTIQAILNNP